MVSSSPKRIAILGNSGSGKSTLARQLHERLGFPTLDLDTVAWVPGEIAVPRDPEDAVADAVAFCGNQEAWIVEGCYANLVDASLRFEPTFLFLDPGVDACLDNCRARPWEPHKYASKAEQDEQLQNLLAWVRDYYTRCGDMSFQVHRDLFDRYDGPKQHLTERPGPDFYPGH